MIIIVNVTVVKAGKIYLFRHPLNVLALNFVLHVVIMQPVVNDTVVEAHLFITAVHRLHQTLRVIAVNVMLVHLHRLHTI